MLAIALSGLLTLVFLIALKLFAPRFGLLDRPGGRKIHVQTTPVVGGIAVFLGSGLALLTDEVIDLEILKILAICLALVVIGAIDDALDMSAKKRLLAHLAAGATMIFFCGERITGLERLLPFDMSIIAALSVPITILAVATAINAINLSDGVDGLAGSIILGVLLILGVVALRIEDISSSLVCFSLAVAITVFLAFNFRFPWRDQAEVFLGDAGSTFMGFALLWLAIRISNNGGFSPIATLWIFAVPVTDILSVILVRRASGRPIFSGSKDHLHHLLLAHKLAPSRVALAIGVCSTAVGLSGVLLDRFGLNQHVLFMLALCVMAMQLSFSNYLRKRIVINNDREIVIPKIAA